MHNYLFQFPNSLSNSTLNSVGCEHTHTHTHTHTHSHTHTHTHTHARTHAHARTHVHTHTHRHTHVKTMSPEKANVHNHIAAKQCPSLQLTRKHTKPMIPSPENSKSAFTVIKKHTNVDDNDLRESIKIPASV